jgi:ribosomal protein S18 acetylase RimI-like enzyme
MADLTLEPATPEGAEAAAELIYQTGPEVFDYLYGDSGTAITYVAAHWVLPQGLFSHALTTVAMEGVNVVGVEQGFAAALKQHHTEATAERFRADLDPAEFTAAETRAKILERMFSDIPPDTYYVEHLAVDTAQRGRGCGRLLLQACFDRTRAAGLAAVHLDVLENNPARDFYLAQGMTDEEQRRVPELTRQHGMPALIRMVKQL